MTTVIGSLLLEAVQLQQMPYCSCPAPEDALLQSFTAAHSPSASTLAIIKSPAAASCRSPRVSLNPT
ncbi:hypothetical protein WN944_027022 [Citrus x changshan-huyou]|uniref:Secreted protein n=1 Tax=Citrus x changshan-huyou TaxID=2935761 RepID=A0AAP0LHU4_9ROSI